MQVSSKRKYKYNMGNKKGFTHTKVIIQFPKFIKEKKKNIILYTEILHWSISIMEHSSFYMSSTLIFFIKICQS